MEITVAGDRAFEPFDFTRTLMPVGEGEPMEQTGKGVHI